MKSKIKSYRFLYSSSFAENLFGVRRVRIHALKPKSELTSQVIAGTQCKDILVEGLQKQGRR